MEIKKTLTREYSIPDLYDVADYISKKSKTSKHNDIFRLERLKEDPIPPDKYEKLADKIRTFKAKYNNFTYNSEDDPNVTKHLSVSMAKGVLPLSGGLYLTNKADKYLDEKQKERSEDIKDKSDEINKRFALIKQLRDRPDPVPEKHPDSSFLEKHGLSLAAGGAAAGLGAYALKKYLDKKKAKK